MKVRSGFDKWIMPNCWRYTYFTWHIFLQVGKAQDLPSKIWQTLGVALTQKQNYTRRVISV
jgi:hypothetical protein